MTDLDLLDDELIEAIADRVAPLVLEKLRHGNLGQASVPVHRTAVTTPRDLETELADLLAHSPGRTVPEIGRALRTRQQTIRRTLKTSARFSSRSGLPGRSPKAKGWFRALDSSPSDPASRTSPVDPDPDGAST